MIEWNKIDFRGRTSGELKTICPNCSHDRKPQNRKEPCLSVNLDKGVGNCKNCLEKTVKVKRAPKKEYNKPPQLDTNVTQLPQNVVDWFKGRGISQKTLNALKISFEKYYQPAKQRKCDNIVFNYFENGELVNKKFRSQDKCFAQIKNAKKVFYGIDDITTDEVYIVEGEIDKLSFWEIGIKNCISVPNGANDLNNIFENCPQVDKIKKIYIAVDMDEAGQKLEHELCKRFGKYRCERVNFKGKDANEDLIDSPLTLEESIKNAQPYPVEGVFGAEDISDDIDQLYAEGLPKTIKPKHGRWNDLNKVFSVMRGQLTTITGIPSHGKSAFIEDYVLALVNDCDLNATFYSPEHLPIALHQQVFAEKFIAKPFFKDYNYENDHVERMTQDELNQYKNWSQGKVKLINADKDAIVDWGWLLDKFRESMFSYGTDIFVIDAFNKVKRKNPDSLGEINQVLADLTAFAQSHDCLIFLIAHPKKPKKPEEGKPYAMPDLYDIKGTGDFKDQTHNGLCVYRHFESTSADGENYAEVINLKTKFRFQGTIGGTADFGFDYACGRFYPRHGTPNRQVLNETEIKPHIESVDYSEPLKPNEDFDGEILDETPF